ncbi:hypothetical protein ScalyP_jg4257 [Parmales sp. scaly parma]|nr:hypothetical protein ScalyP_jg4257 [Parmales sp. scaly parma]
MKQVTTKLVELAARPEVKERVAASNTYRNLCIQNDCPDMSAFSLSIAVCIVKGLNLADNWEWQVNDIKRFGKLRFGRGNNPFWATKGVDADEVRLGSKVLSSALASIKGLEYELKWASTNQNGEPSLSPAVALGISLTNKVECGNSEPTFDQCEMFGVTPDVIQAKCKSCKLTKDKFIAFCVKTSGVQKDINDADLQKFLLVNQNDASQGTFITLAKTTQDDDIELCDSSVLLTAAKALNQKAALESAHKEGFPVGCTLRKYDNYNCVKFPDGGSFRSLKKAKDHAKQHGHVFDDDVAARKLALELAHDKGLPVDWQATKYESGTISFKSPEGQFFGTFQKALAHAKQHGHVFRVDDSKLTLARERGLPDGWQATKYANRGYLYKSPNGTTFTNLKKALAYVQNTEEEEEEEEEEVGEKRKRNGM